MASPREATLFHLYLNSFSSHPGIGTVRFAAQEYNKSAEKNFYITTEQKEQSIITGRYEKNNHLDSVSVAYDSLAFWEGVTQYTAEKMSEKLLREKGIKILHSQH